MRRKQPYKLSLTILTLIIINSLIGAGFFDLPKDVLSLATVTPMLIGILLSLIAALCLALVFKELSMRKPKLNTGVYAYAKEGFGHYIGFNSAWAYWIQAWIGNISMLIMICMALATFFPSFGDGITTTSLVFSSILIWIVTFLCSLGPNLIGKVNAYINTLKFVVIGILLFSVLLEFDMRTFKANLALSSLNKGSILSQVSDISSFMLWSFIGIEGASVLSAYAEDRRDIGKATMLGLVITFCIMFLMVILPLVCLIMSKSQNSSRHQPLR